MASIATSIEIYDKATQPLMMVVNALHATVNAMSAVNTAMGSGMDTSSIERATQEIENAVNEVNNLQSAIQNVNSETLSPTVLQNEPTSIPNEPIKVPVEPEVPEPLIPKPEPVEIPISWQSDNMEVFTNTGVDRFEQEIQSANNIVNQLVQNQQRISQTASGIDILPDDASAEINAMTQRISNLQQKLQQLESTPVSLRTDAVNNKIEQLRSNLSQAVESQNELNSALERMDVEAANASYLQLSRTVSNTERLIRDNTNEQGHFNQEIQQGVQQSNELMKTIKNIIVAYMSIQTVKKAMDLSDELTQTTARLGMMNDAFNKVNGTAMQTNDLVQMVYQSAQNVRGEFSAMAAVVAKFGNNARDAFSSQREVIDFANLIQKQMTIAGASGAEASNAMLQLSQALGSGALRGDELNSIFEQAPNLIQSIADYLDVPIGQIRKMAQEGQLSADIVKQAIFASADNINAQFEKMPMTWNQVWTTMQNTAIMQLQPVLDKINELANNEQFQAMLIGLMDGFASIVMILLTIMEVAATVAQFFTDNWSIISPIIYGIVTALGLYLAVLAIVNTVNLISAGIAAVKAAADMMQAGATFAATVAQHGLNAALLACPLTWIIALIILLIVIIFMVANAIAKMTGVANTGFGVITGGINVVIAFFKNLGLTVANIALGIGAAIGAVASNMMTAFNNAISNIQSWFYNLLSTACSVIAGIAEALNKLPFVEFDYSGIVNAADDYAAKSAAAAGNVKEYTSIADAFKSGSSTFDAFQSGWTSNAFKSGASWGDGVMGKLSNMLNFDSKIPKIDTGSMFNGGYTPSDYSSGGYDGSNVPKNIADTAGNTARAADSLQITDENLKYLRDIAERDVINRFTTAEITVEMNNTNNINNDMDLDGVIDYLATGVQDAMEKAAEGVHD